MINRCDAPEIHTLRIILPKFLVLPVLRLSCPFIFYSVCYSCDRYNFALEVVINTLVTVVLIVSCESSVHAFKTNDQPVFIAC